jgi:hypothetical protein
MKFQFCVFLFVYYSFSSIYAQSYYPQDGIYGGLESGIAVVNVNGAFSSIRSSGESDEFISLNYEKSVIGINLGYGRYFEESLAGLEIHHSFYTSKINEIFVQGDFEFDVTIGSKSEVDLVLGRKIGTRSLLTLRCGLAFSNINLIADYNSGAERYNLNKQWFGYSLGMGYVFGIGDYLAVKTKYNLTSFRNQLFSDTTTKLVDNRFTLSLIYTIWTLE